MSEPPQRAEDVGPSDDNAIAIVGMALHVPGAATPDQFWRNLRDGVDCGEDLDDAEILAEGVSERDLADPNYVKRGAFLRDLKGFDPEFFGLSAKEGAIMDPQHRHFLEVCWEALERSGHVPSRFEGAIGVFAGCGMGKYMMLNLIRNQGVMDSTGYFLVRHTGNDKDFLTTRVSYSLNLQGPSVGIQTACSTSLVAVHTAAQSLLSGECDMALAGGVTLEVPHRVGYLYRENEILSPDGRCRPFDHRSKGTIFGSGAGVVALRRLADAIADGDHIHAVVRGSAVNNDGSLKVGYLAPSVDGQAAAVSEAIEIAGVDADSIGYVEAHGTGTVMGDPIEIRALSQAYRESTEATGYCGIGSVKSNIGHLDTAAGVVGLIKAALALEHRQIPPSLHWEAPNPNIDFDSSPFYVAHELRDWPAGRSPRRAGVNSLGVGGTNAHVILEEAPAPSGVAGSVGTDQPVVLRLSGRSPGSLDDQGAQLAEHLRTRPEVPLSDVACTLARHRHDFPMRRVLACGSRDEAIQLLEKGDRYRVFTHRAAAGPPSAVLMFPGGGAQYPGMAAGLYRDEPAFREQMDRCLGILQDQHDLDLQPFLFPGEPADAALAGEFERPSLQLPAILAVEVSLAALWQGKGLSPKALIGHSMGENAAACVAGVMSLEDVLGLVVLRGRLFEQVHDGGMLSVLLSPEDLQEHLDGELVLAVENGPELSVVSGPAQAIAALGETLQAREVEVTRIPIEVAAHSPLLDPILGPFRGFLQGIQLNPPQLPLISNRTGTWMTAGQATDPEYWVEHLRGTVRFSAGLGQVLRDHPEAVLIEAGPGATLSALARMQPDFAEGHHGVQSLRHPDHTVDDGVYWHTAMGRMWAAGTPLEQDPTGTSGRRTPLPTYPFQRREYWIDPPDEGVAKRIERLPRLNRTSDWFQQPEWWPAPAMARPDGAAHRWLVFCDGLGIGAKVAEALRQRGDQVVTVRLAAQNQRLDAHDYTIDSDRGPEGYGLLAQGLAEDGLVCDRILHLWGVTGRESLRSSLNRFAHNLERGFWSLFHLFRALGEREALTDAQAVVLTHGARQVTDEPLDAPEKATVDGPCLVAPREFPGLNCRSVDLAPTLKDVEPGVQPRRWFRQVVDPTAEAVAQVLAEAESVAASGTYAWRGGQRYELRYRTAEESGVSPAGSAVIRQGGVYVITGGLGGIGLAVAESLALTADVHLVLVSRSGLPARERWEDVVRGAEPGDRRADAIQKIRRLEGLGATVQVAAVDVTDHESMTAMVERVEAAHGPVRGVIHAAGTVQDEPMLAKQVSTVETVFAAKVYGTQVLDLMFRERPLDFMVLFSSTSTALAPAGQVDYVAANAWLDAFASSATDRPWKRTLSLAWGAWHGVGLAAAALGDTPVSGRPGRHPLIHEVWSRGATTVMEMVPLSSATHWVLDEHRLEDGRALLSGTTILELARAAWAELADGADLCVIRDVRFLLPMEESPGGVVRQRIHAVQKADGVRLEFQSQRSAVNGDSGWLTHAEAVVAGADDAAPEPVDVAVLVDRCRDHLREGGDQHLVTAQERHLRFGPRWGCMISQGFGAGEAVARLRLAEEYRGDLDRYPLHPALLDIGTGHGMELIRGYDAEAGLWVPVSYDAVHIHGPLPAEILSHVRLRGDARRDDSVVVFDVDLLSPDGRLLVEVQGIAITPAPAGDLMAPLRRIPPDSLQRDVPKVVVAPGDGDGGVALLREVVAQGIRPEEGMGLFREALGRGGSRLLVSPVAVDVLQDKADSMAHEATAGADSGSFERPDLAAEFVEPQTGTEQRLQGIWQELLGVEPVGVEDSFFDLGGHSLLAVRLFARIRKELGVALPISALIESATIRELAALMPESEDATGESSDRSAVAAEIGGSEPPASRGPWTSLVRLTSAGNGTPFFCVAGKGGNPLNIRHFARHLGEDRPVYGIQHRGADGVLPVHESIEEMAAACVRDVQAVQPKGPYLLGGFSGGGLVAFEMARVLKTQGETVGLLALFDSPSPSRHDLTRSDRLKLHLEGLRDRHIGYVMERIQHRLEGRRRRKLRAATVAAGPQEVPPHIAVGLAWDRMEMAYSAEPLPMAGLLFRPYVTDPGDVDRFLNQDEFNGWQPYLAEGVQVVEVPGGHATMFEEPHVRILAKRVRELIPTD